MAGTLHKWLGRNDWHDQMSLYSYSWLRNGQSAEKGLAFPRGASWFFSAHEPDMVRQLVSGIQQDPEMFAGLKVKEVTIQDEPTLFNSKETYFRTASPVFIRRNVEGGQKHFTIDDPETDDLLTETFQHKLKTAGLPTEGARVRFDRNYPNPRIKVIYFDKIGNRTTK